MDPLPATALDRPVDRLALARVQRRLWQAAQPPWLHAEVARRMADRLPIIKLQPKRVLDWGASLGASQEVLQQAYPQAKLWAVEPDPMRRDAAAARLAAPWWSARRWRGTAHSAVLESEVQAAQGELLWCNMQLHGVSNPQSLFAHWHRALGVGGFLMFSTLGPGTLQALRELYKAAGWGSPMAALVDMHDLGDMLVQAGFADPVMDQEIVTLTWATPDALLAELRTLGGNADPRRHPGLRTPRWRERLHQRLSERLAVTDAAGTRLALGFELVYGHAFRAPPRARAADETVVSVDQMRAMARAGGRRR